jgi:hypothetical protein
VRTMRRRAAVLAAAGLVASGLVAAGLVASVGVGSASAAAHPAVMTKTRWQAAIARVQGPGIGCYRASYPALRWHAVRCGSTRLIPLAPARRAVSARHAAPTVVGNHHDYSAKVGGLISRATGTFKDVSRGITERGGAGSPGASKPNIFSLQLNSQFFAGSPACSGSSHPARCRAWQQFVYDDGLPAPQFYIQYWLLGHGPNCPPGWDKFPPDCYRDSAQVLDLPSRITARELATVRLSASAKAGGKDEESLSTGSGHAYLVTANDSVVDLARFWNTTEWGVFGGGGGQEAYFGPGTTLQAQTALTDTGSRAPVCVREGFTEETNNLKLAATPALGRKASPTMASRQTNGTSGTASCVTAS